MVRNYRDLEVWKRAVDLAESVYRASQTWPAAEQYGLTGQVRRAAVSVASNIAEGEGRRSDADFSRFLRIANGSLREVETQLLLAHRLEYLPTDHYRALFKQCNEIGRLLNGLLRSLKRNPSDG